MCGIVGIMGGGSSATEAKNRIKQMQQMLQHRGPDDEGIYIHPQNKPIYLGHSRLAIIDPEHGKQPMTTPDGRVTVIFNGAIYNYLELRRELISRSHGIHSFSDTEVILYAYLEWGESCINKFHGMFAFALWDNDKQILFCARDRIGIKPFYFYHDGKTLVFASEIKAILASGYVDAVPNSAALQDYITFQFSLQEKTLFKDINKLEPGHYFVAKLENDKVKLIAKQYWDVVYNVEEGRSESYFVDHLTALIEDSIHQHLRSDVPLGAHLSGGMDSSAVACMSAQKLQGVSFKTFTGAFNEGPQFDETVYAKQVAKFIGADYNEVYIQNHDLNHLLPKLIYHMDEPVAGPGLIPQYYVSELAARHVKVVLGGQGGDEIFVGYARYLVAYLEKCLQNQVFQDKHADSSISLASILPNLGLLKNYKPMLQHFWRDGLFGADDSRYFRLIDRGEGMNELFAPEVFKDYSSFESYQQIFNREGLNSLIDKMTYFDLKGSLPALLQVEDRTSMAVSVESRVPLLDHRLVEFMATVPPEIKFANGNSKHLFKNTLKNVLPKEILERKDKMGFPVPLNQWFKNELKDFVADVLFSQRAKERGIYNIKKIEDAYNKETQFGRISWGLLCLELWHRVYVDGGWKEYIPAA